MRFNRTFFLSLSFTFLLVISHYLPFANRTSLFPSETLVTEWSFHYVPIFLAYLITFLPVIWKNKATAIISFVLCFGLIFSLLIQYMLVEHYFMEKRYDFTLNIGFYLSVLATFMLFFLRLGNMFSVVKRFETAKKQMDLLDN